MRFSTPPPAFVGRRGVGAGHRDWLPQSSIPPGWDGALTALEVVAKCQFSVSVPAPNSVLLYCCISKRQRCSAGRKGLQRLPFPHNTHQVGSVSSQHHPHYPGLHSMLKVLPAQHIHLSLSQERCMLPADKQIRCISPF